MRASPRIGYELFATSADALDQGAIQQRTYEAMEDSAAAKAAKKARKA